MARPHHHRRKAQAPDKRKAQAPARRVTARIDALAAGGDGVALVDGGRVYVPLTAPGDLAEIDARGESGTLVRLLEKGPGRVEPPCRHYGACGGCSLQHLDAALYRDLKLRRIAAAIRQEGLADIDIGAMIETPAASRRRATFAVKKTRGGVRLGFNARRSSMIEEISDCVILDPHLVRRLPALRALAAKIETTEFDLAVTLCDNGLDLAVVGAANEPRGPALVEVLSLMRAAGALRLSIAGEIVAAIAPPIVTFDGVAVTQPPGAFLQASREGEAALTGLVKNAARGARKIADLFSGCGTFALPLARQASVFAADSDRAAIEALARGAAAAQADGLNPVATEARNLWERPLTVAELNGFDAVVFDPPRAGGAAQAETIAASKVPLAIGVSCNPATFARDAASLLRGGYTLTSVIPVDQFVYSTHVELVGVFRKA